MFAPPVNMALVPAFGESAAGGQRVPNDGLPDTQGLWPPRPFDVAQKAFHIWSSWYGSDIAELQNIYIQANMVRPTAWAGGLTGRLQRYWWGRPNLQSSPRIHVPAPSDLSRTSADLLFAEPPTYYLGADETVVNKDKAQSRLDLVFGGDDTTSILLEGAELASALGGVYLRAWWDQEISDHVMLSTAAADCAVPTFRYGRLVAVTFWTLCSTDNGQWVRHLERHESGRILHGLYLGDQGQLGDRIPLTESPETAWVADISQDGIINTGVKGLTATYIPNQRPNRQWRLTPGLSPLGRSDYDGLEPLFDVLDMTMSNWMQDVDLGKARIFVDESLLVTQKPGVGATFDNEQNIYTKLRGTLGSIGSGNDQGIQAIQFDIRWQEHSQTCAEILNTILRAAGISTGSFADTSLTIGAPTATEINSRDNLSEITRTKKGNHWRAGMSGFIQTAMQIDAAVFGTGLNLTDAPKIEFPSRSMEAPQELAQTIQLLALAQAISTQEMVTQQHPNWTAEEVQAEVQRIREEVAQGAKQAGFGIDDPHADPTWQSPFPSPGEGEPEGGQYVEKQRVIG